VGGQGTGANLATVVALEASSHGEPRIALQLLICPVTDGDLGRPSYHDAANQVSLTRDAVAREWAAYVPEVAQRNRPEVAPLQASQAQMSSMPSTVIITAEHDPLHDEGELYARALLSAGVQVDYRCHPGQMHGFFTTLQLPGSERGSQQVVKAIRACLAYEFQATPELKMRQAAKNEIVGC